MHVRLPVGRHFTVAWHVPDDYGGMTDALLHRSAAFARLGGVEVDVLTFDARPDYPELEVRLRARGALESGVRLRNLYDWLRENPLDGGRPYDPDRTPATPIAEHLGVVARRGSRVMSRTRFAADGVTMLQRDHYREDGTIVVSDRRDTDTPGILGGRSVVLFDDRGRPVRGFRRVRSLYHAWLDRLAGDERAFLLIDSTVTAELLLDYRRPRTVMVHVLHNSHLAAPADPEGALQPRRIPVLENLDRFDAIAVLTHRQRVEMRARFGRTARLRVIPNGRNLPRSGQDVRPAAHGVVLASLTGRKRVDHAIRAAGRVRGSSLDIYGSGPARPALEALAARQAHGAVVFHGHRPDARDRLAEASFLVLSSRFEGSPLVLAEALAAGCLPIAYDVRYGPRDVIRNGRTGWLVPEGDVAALSAAIRGATALGARRQRRMRRAARRSARRFSDEAVTWRWARELRQAQRRHQRRNPRRDRGGSLRR